MATNSHWQKWQAEKIHKESDIFNTKDDKLLIIEAEDEFDNDIDMMMVATLLGEEIVVLLKEDNDSNIEEIILLINKEEEEEELLKD